MCISKEIVRRAGEVAITESSLLIFGEGKIRRSFLLGDITAIQVDEEWSVKHPLIGGIFAIVLIGISVSLFSPNIFVPGSETALKGYWSAKAVVGVFFSFVTGVYLLYKVITIKKVCLINVKTFDHQYSFVVSGATREETTQVVESIKEKPGQKKHI